MYVRRFAKSVWLHSKSSTLVANLEWVRTEWFIIDVYQYEISGDSKENKRKEFARYVKLYFWLKEIHQATNQFSTYFIFISSMST